MRAALAALVIASAACGGSGGSDSGGGCAGECAQVALSAADVEIVLAQAVAEAERLERPATIAVLDRVGNVLAVFRMTGAAATTAISGQRGISTGLEKLVVPAELAAISKAGSGAYLSSQGNAFSSRTASQIVQENFNPGERGRPGGPLFGVQLSQLPCGDLVTRIVAADPGDRTGPRRLPLGLSADPGGIPLYKPSSGGGAAGMVPAGAIGVEMGCSILDACARCATTGDACPSVEAVVDTCGLEGLYTLDRKPEDFDTHLEERIAVAGAAGFEAPAFRRAEKIVVEGKTLRFADDESAGVPSAAACADLGGAFVAVAGFSTVAGCNDLMAGTVLGEPGSGIRETVFSGMPAEVLVDGAGGERFAPVGGTSLTAAEVRTILEHALAVALRARAQIRRPLGSSARVSVSVVDTTGAILGIVRARDAPVFGIDVSLQKARTAAFFSSAGARGDLEAAGQGVYVDALTAFLTTRGRFRGEPIAAGDVLAGTIAFSDRAGGNLSRPFFPDGINGNSNGPLSRPFAAWSPFSTGLQLDLVLDAAAGLLCADIEAPSCSTIPSLASGIQIFPGSVPIYSGTTLVGGIGVSGDGVDQDDLIAFLGLHEAGVALGGAIGNAPPEIRADNVSVDGSNLRFVNCPVKPFLAGDEQGACDGL